MTNAEAQATRAKINQALDALIQDGDGIDLYTVPLGGMKVQVEAPVFMAVVETVRRHALSAVVATEPMTFRELVSTIFESLK